MVRRAAVSSPLPGGKVERFHQTLKEYLARQDPPATRKQLQAQLDRSAAYYSEVRPLPCPRPRHPAKIRIPIGLEHLPLGESRQDLSRRPGLVSWEFCDRLACRMLPIVSGANEIREPNGEPMPASGRSIRRQRAMVSAARSPIGPGQPRAASLRMRLKAEGRRFGPATDHQFCSVTNEFDPWRGAYASDSHSRNRI